MLNNIKLMEKRNYNKDVTNHQPPAVYCPICFKLEPLSDLFNNFACLHLSLVVHQKKNVYQ